MKRPILTMLVFFASGALVHPQDYYNRNDFFTVKKIDAHFHIRTSSDAAATQAAADGFQLVNVSVASSDSSLRLQEHFTLYQKKAHPDQVVYISAFSMANWDSPRWAEETILQLKKAFANGASGIKIWKNIGMVERDKSGKLIMIDDPRFDPVIRFVVSQDKTVLGHLGEPRNCWLPLEQMTVNNDRNYFRNHPQYHMFLHPEYPGYQQQIDARDRFLARHPSIRFVGAHLASLEYDVDSLANRLDRFPNMAVDMAARICHLQYQSMLDHDKVRNFIIKYQDRLLYGTDLGMDENDTANDIKKQLHEQWLEDWKYFTSDESMKVPEVNGVFKGLKLPKQVVDKIYYENAVKWFAIRKQ